MKAVWFGVDQVGLDEHLRQWLATEAERELTNREWIVGLAALALAFGTPIKPRKTKQTPKSKTCEFNPESVPVYDESSSNVPIFPGNFTVLKRQMLEVGLSNHNRLAIDSTQNVLL